MPLTLLNVSSRHIAPLLVQLEAVRRDLWAACEAGTTTKTHAIDKLRAKTFALARPAKVDPSDLFHTLERSTVDGDKVTTHDAPEHPMHRHTPIGVFGSRVYKKTVTETDGAPGGAAVLEQQLRDSIARAAAKKMAQALDAEILAAAGILAAATPPEPVEMPAPTAAQSKREQRLLKKVTLHGVAITLLELKSFLSKQGITADTIAKAATTVCPDTPFTSVDITPVLSGRDIFVFAVQKGLENLIPPDTMRQFARAQNAAPAPVAPAKTLTQNLPVKKSGVPSFAKTMGVIPTDPNATAPLPGVSAVVAQAQSSAASMPQFPLDLAYRTAGMVRKSHGTEISATFSLRKLQMWADAYLLLLKDGFEQTQAVGGAFHLAVLAKEYGEAETFIANAFNQIFGYVPVQPEIPEERIKQGGLRHPASYLLEPLLRENRNVWLVGDTGVGKTFMVESLIADVLKRDYVRIQGTGDMNVDDLLGGMGAKSGTTNFEYGPLPYCMGRVDGIGRPLYINEVTTAHSDVLFELQAVLEGKPLVLKKNRGERIVPAEGFSIVVDDNTLGLGEKPEYIGTKVMNEAFRDRFYFLRVGYMPESQEKEILARFIEEQTSRTLTLVDSAKGAAA